MENKELIEWAIVGLEASIYEIDKDVRRCRRQLKEYEVDHIDTSFMRKGLQARIAEKEALQEKLFALKFERDLEE